jgi:hypothetical protein
MIEGITLPRVGRNETLLEEEGWRELVDEEIANLRHCLRQADDLSEKDALMRNIILLEQEKESTLVNFFW